MAVLLTIFKNSIYFNNWKFAANTLAPIKKAVINIAEHKDFPLI